MVEQEKVSLDEACDMLARMKEGTRWFQAVSISGRNLSRDNLEAYRSAVARVQQGLDAISDILGPSTRITLQAYSGKRRGLLYRWAERSILCHECKRAPGINLTMYTNSEGSPSVAGPFTIPTPAERLSTRQLCDTCLEKLERLGAFYDKRRPWTLVLAQLWGYKGIPAFSLTLVSLGTAVAALIW